MKRGKLPTSRGTERGQSEVIGLILVFGVTFIGIAVILVTGTPVLNDANENAQTERIQTEFATLDHEIRESAYTVGQSGASVALSEGGVFADNGTDSMSIEVSHSSIGDAEVDAGGMVYETDGTAVAYQMGGVWATYRNGGYALRTPPDITYTGRSLTMDITNFTSNVRVSGGGGQEFLVRSEGTDTSKFEDLSDGILPAGEELTVTVETDPVRGIDKAWREYFERTFPNGDVSGTNGVAEVQLDTGPPIFAVEYLEDRYEGPSSALGGILDPLPIADLDDDEVIMYDSSIGNETDYAHKEDVGGSSIPLPSVSVQACVHTGSGEPFPNSPETITSGTYENSSGQMTLSSGYEFDTSGGDITVYESGNGIRVTNGVEFDTSGGTVEIHTQNGLDVQPNGEISINGSNPVRFYVDGDVEIDGEVDIEDNDTELLQIYTTGDGEVDGNDAKYFGAMYAPDGSIEVGSDAEFRGAAIAGSGVSEPVEVDGEYYHDTSLRQADLPDCITEASGFPVSQFDGTERMVSLR